MKQAPRLTAARAHRAIDALVALMETGQLSAAQTDLDRACDAIREACRRANIDL